MDIPSVFRLVNTGVQILRGEICIFSVQQVDEFEICSTCHLVDDSLEGICHSGHCDQQDWLIGRYKCWMPVRGCRLDFQQAVGHGIRSLERIPLPLYTENAGHVVVRQNHPLFKGIPPWNGQWQPHYNFLSNQFAKHYRCNWGESISNTHFIRHQCSWHISIPYPSPHNEPDGPNLVRQKRSSGQTWNWKFVAWNTVIYWLAHRMGIQQPDCLIKTLMLKFVVDCVENSAQDSIGIIWIEGRLAIHLLLNLSWTLFGPLFILNDLFQLLRGQFGIWAHTPALLKLIAMLGIPQTSTWTQ